MGTKLTIVFEESDDNGFESQGWSTTSIKTHTLYYPSGTVWTSFILDMADACEGVGYIGVKNKIRFLGQPASDRDEEYRQGEDTDAPSFDYS